MSGSRQFRFRLYIAGDAPNSLQAVANLNSFCRKHLPDKFAIEIVDVFREPKRAFKEGIFMTPTLVKLAPSPVRKIVGALTQPHILLQTLDLESYAA